LCNGIRIFKIGLRYSFICQGNSTRRQRRDLFGFRVKLPPVTSSLTTHRQKCGRRQRGAGGPCSSQDFHTWYRYSRGLIVLFSVFFRCPPSGRGLIVLFFGLFCYFSVFFPLDPLEFFCRRPWAEAFP